MSLSQCIEQDGENANGQQEEEFDLQQAAECGRLDVDEEAAQYYAYQNGQSNNQYNNQNQQNVEFFVGPTCSSNGKSINLAVFMDETCSYSAPDGVYEKFNYGKKLPYSSSSIVEHDCISCLEPAEEEDENNNQDGNNNNNNNYNNNQDDAQPEVLEVCERLYEPAGKCETNLQIYGMYPNTMACEFISGLNHWSLAGVTSSLKSAKKNVTPSVLAGVFAATTVVLAAVAYNLNKKVRRQAVGLMPYDEAQHVPY